jgi:hypothetical protein
MFFNIQRRKKEIYYFFKARIARHLLPLSYVKFKEGDVGGDGGGLRHQFEELVVKGFHLFFLKTIVDFRRGNDICFSHNFRFRNISKLLACYLKAFLVLQFEIEIRISFIVMSLNSQYNPLFM